VPIGAVIFDFNGTLSHDEPILLAIFQELFAEYGRPLSEEQYFGGLAGLSDTEIVRTWLGPDHPAVETAIGQRIARYRERVADGSTVGREVRDAVRYAAARVPVAIVSGASRSEIEPVLEAAGLAALVGTVVAEEDASRGKPDPAGYLRALELIGNDLSASDVLVFEDSEAGIAAAKAAGMRCVAVLGTLPPERLGGADEIVTALNVELMERLLG